MKFISDLFFKHIFWLKWAVVLIILTIGIIFISSGNESILPFTESKKTNGESINPTLIYAAEDLNNVLPQRLELNTFFDSVGVSQNQLHYYYSISNLTRQDFLERELHDSLYTEAVDRIPCTLWRPLYMQGVEVTFTYYSVEGEQLLQFNRAQEGSCQ